MRRRRRSTAGGAALPAALAVSLVALVLAAGIADTLRIELALARTRRAAAMALAAADGCLARALSVLPAGWDFGEVLAGDDRLAGTGDDGVIAVPAGCTALATAAPGPALPPRVRVTVEGQAGGGRREVEGLVGRAGPPGVPALLWLSDLPPASGVGGDVTLDGVDPTLPPGPTWAGIAAPGTLETLDAWAGEVAAHLTPDSTAAPPLAAPAPPLAGLDALVQAQAPGGAETLVPAGPAAPRLTRIAGDLLVPGPLVGAGLLFVDGTLDISGAFNFTGVVVAMGGVRIAAGAELAIDGALWLGLPATPADALVVDGTLAVRRSGAALAAADALLSLPRRPVLLGLRDAG